MNPAEAREVFQALRAILARTMKRALVTENATSYMLNSAKKDAKGRHLWLGGVRIGKSYVSYHLMAVYCFPDLLDGISDALRARKQGKACFNFRKPDPALFKELAKLTEQGVRRFRKGLPEGVG